MRIFGIDPGSVRTGYGCVETDGRRHRLIACGAINPVTADALPQRLACIHRELTALLRSCKPECVAVENLFHAVHARSALTLGHARGVAILAAVEAGCEVVEYTPAAVKRAVVGYGRADKYQVQQMVKLLLGLDQAPSPHDAADALAVAICHLHSMPMGRLKARFRQADLKVRLYADSSTTVEAGLPPSRKVSADHRSLGEGGQARLPKPDRQGRRPKPGSWRQYKPPAG